MIDQLLRFSFINNFCPDSTYIIFMFYVLILASSVRLRYISVAQIIMGQVDETKEGEKEHAGLHVRLVFFVEAGILHSEKQSLRLDMR